MPYEKIGKNEPVCITDEVPFDIPESWEWVRLGSISTYADTKKKINAQNAPKDLWGLDLEDIEKGGRLLYRKTVGERNAKGDKTYFSAGDILYSKLRPYLLKILVAPENGICTSEIVPFKVFGNICAEYIVNYLKSPYVDNLINSITYGVKMPRVGTETMVNLLVPIPPLFEQQRIVDKILEAETKLAEYTNKETLLNTLQNTFPDTLKKSILQWAVQGKLVPQDPADEPASILLERIRTEKQRLVREGKIKKAKHESVIFRRDNSHYEKHDSEEICIDDELPFEIPENWCWARLGELCSIVTGRLDANAQTPDGEFAFFTCGREVFKTNTYAFDCDAILLGGNNASGDYKMHRYVGKFNAYQRVYVISGADSIVLDYLYYVITFWLGHLKKNSQGTTTRFIKLGQVTGMLVPFPPYDEQKKILSAIEQLLKQCKRLK